MLTKPIETNIKGLRCCAARISEASEAYEANALQSEVHVPLCACVRYYLAYVEQS